jgi:putative transposase
MGQWCGDHKVEIWAYCQMLNQFHLIAVPQSADGLKRAIGDVHCRYTRMINSREGWRGHLWQGRFASFVLDKPSLLTPARYIELNPCARG